MKKTIWLIALFVYSVTAAIAQNSLQKVKIALSSSRAELIIQMSTGISQVAFVQLTDLQGRVLSVQNIPANKTNSGQIKIGTQHLIPGMYFVHLVNARHQTIATQKIIKQ